MNKEVPSLLIDKYLKGECSAEEAKIVIDWYDSFYNDSDPVLLMSASEQERLRESMLERIRETAYPVKARSSKLYSFYAAVASIAALLLIVMRWLTPDADPVRAQANIIPAKTVHAEVNIVNTNQRLFKCTLPDGSSVWLKPKAAIGFNKVSFRKSRIVKLNGEAFFDVTKDKEHPFSIYTGDVVTRVLGTSFNIKSGKSKTEVSVVTGKVLVYTRHTDNIKKVYLLPKQKAVYTSKGESLVKNSVVGTSLNMWKKNTLSFDNSSVTEIIKVLNAEFKANIVISSTNLKTYTLTADFTDVNLPTILELLSKSLSIQYVMDGDKISIYDNYRQLTNHD